MPGLNLTHMEAKERGRVITRVNTYKVSLNLTGEGETFRSKTEIRFQALEGSQTFLDLVAKDLVSAKLNGADIPLGSYEDNRLPLTGLREENVLEVVGDFYYMNTGEGMHRSVDPADGKTYLYTQFEVPDARRVYPTFEQPDLKASFTFDVTVPEEWTVFSVSPTPVPTPVGDGLQLFAFAPTPRISTYITAIVAGPYEGETATIRSIDGREIELGVYARASLRKYLDASDIMNITEQGFGFFENAYGIPYPFTKYDQIFVPEYNAGAMENAGCVTIRDQFIYRSKPTDWEREERANVILHELAHMWFGNLVTMKWWEDLWLNESFAEYMSHLATQRATEWPDAWVGFLGRKEWGLSQDQKPTTHPVRTPMKDLEDVEVNFDGITYAKGAAVLRQMVSYVGEQNFFDGLHRYLSKHSWDNAELDDLLVELEATSGRDMGRWTRLWVEESGVNTLRPKVEVDADGNLASLSVLQTSDVPEVSLRPHRLIVSGYSLGDDGRVEPDFKVELDVDGEETPVTGTTAQGEDIFGRPRPDLILVNDGDLAYAKVRLDADSLKFAEEHIAKFEDPLTRRVILGAAWDMTRDAEMPATQFLELALNAAGEETSVATLDSLLSQISTAATRFTAPVHRLGTLLSVATRLAALARNAAPGSDAQELFVKAFAAHAVTQGQGEFILNLYRGEMVLEGLEVGDEILWELLFAAIRLGVAGEEQIEERLAADPTLSGQENAARARATINSDAVREQTWEAVVTDDSIPNETRWAMARGFWAHAATLPNVYAPFASKFFGHVTEVWEGATFQVAARVLKVMNPTPLAGYVASVDVPALGEAWLAANEGAPDALRRLITEGWDDAKRMVAAQAEDAQQ